MKRLTTIQKLLLSYLLLVLAMILFVSVFFLPYELHKQTEVIENDLNQVAKSIAIDNDIKTDVYQHSFKKKTIQMLDQILDIYKDDIAHISICDTNGIRLYQNDHSLIGKKFVGNDYKKTLSGKHYMTTHQGVHDLQRRAFYPIYHKNEVVGFVLTSQSLKKIDEVKHSIIITFTLISFLIFLLGILFSLLISKSIRRILLGYEPSEFAKMYLQREAILEHLDEGLLCLNNKEEILYQNSSFPDNFHKELLTPYFNDVQVNKKSLIALMIKDESKSYLVNVLPIFNPEEIAVLFILRDQSPIIELKHSSDMIDALSHHTHSYLNKLHVISGLLQLDEIERAMSFIHDNASIDKNYYCIVKDIHDRQLAALLLGKMNKAKEKDVSLQLLEGSSLSSTLPLSSDEIVQIVGNLIENAFDAHAHYIDIFIKDTKGLYIEVSDDGDGIDEDILTQIKKETYTSKGEGHGYGLSFIRHIVYKYQGTLDIHSKKDMGSTFTIMIKDGKND